MKPIAIQNYVFFGTALRYLQDANQNYRVAGDGGVMENIRLVLKYIDDFSLKVTFQARGDLIKLYEKLDAQKPVTLTPELIVELRGAVDDLRKVQQAECSIMFAYIITEKRIDVQKLLNNPNNLFAPAIFPRLPDTPAYDITEAAKCIAFERPTAAAFHILRATEFVLRELYCCEIKRNRCEPLLWGPMTKHLRDRKKIADVLLNNLDNIRVNFRNPTQHPEMIYDIHGVQDLFPLCVDVITRMVKLLPASAAHSSTSPAAVLAPIAASSTVIPPTV